MVEKRTTTIVLTTDHHHHPHLPFFIATSLDTQLRSHLVENPDFWRMNHGRRATFRSLFRPLQTTICPHDGVNRS